MRLIDADRLIELMTDRDNDCSEPKNAIDKGYSLAVEHMKWEIEQNNDYHCKAFDLADHDKQIINKYRDKVKEDVSARLKARKHYLTDDEYEHEVEATRNMISALDYFADKMKGEQNE